MGRPAKATATKTGKVTKEVEKARKATENRLKGGENSLKPPEYMTETQAAIFTYIADHLKEVGILGNLDLFVLERAAMCIDRVRQGEIMINKDWTLRSDTAFMASQAKYSTELGRLYNELSMSPQARAKISVANVNAMLEAKKKNPLLEALNDS